MTCKIGSPIALGVAAETHVYARVRAFLRESGHAQLLRLRLD